MPSLPIDPATFNQFEMTNISYQRLWERSGTQDQNLLEQTHSPANVT
jgi:hypothetical protein